MRDEALLPQACDMGCNGLWLPMCLGATDDVNRRFAAENLGLIGPRIDMYSKNREGTSRPSRTGALGPLGGLAATARAWVVHGGTPRTKPSPRRPGRLPLYDT